MKPLLALFVCAVLPAQEPTERERQLLERIQLLENRLVAVESRLPPAGPPAQAPPTPAPVVPPTATFNVMLDGYYGYNFNQPADRITPLRPFDSSSNNFTLSQAVVAIERAPDFAQGRRFGLRLDLMFGQATETLGANPANEPRPAPYRNIYQAYGTYLISKDLSVDFGRFSSPHGMESSYSKDQLNYSRSLLFTALPFYHMGFRTSYKLSEKATASWLLVNGMNQTEDFNAPKSNSFILSTTPTKNLAWTVTYHIGSESSRTQIGDSYFSWTAAKNLTLAAEGDYIASGRAHLAGGAAYARYQFVPAFSLAGRYEYVNDGGGWLSGRTQALQEGTVTATWQPADGFQMRWEYRHDHSDQGYFPSRTHGLRPDQNTALLGLVWWFGGKQGAW